MEGGSGKKMKMLFCQVDDCRADLSCAKDYHRRHKVCEIHSKANKALVANEMQRFCQQCSREAELLDPEIANCENAKDVMVQFLRIGVACAEANPGTELNEINKLEANRETMRKCGNGYT
ncbi:hypothetical protein Droror1_Dr00026155 [Drosera rotundifolia]